MFFDSVLSVIGSVIAIVASVLAAYVTFVKFKSDYLPRQKIQLYDDIGLEWPEGSNLPKVLIRAREEAAFKAVFGRPSNPKYRAEFYKEYLKGDFSASDARYAAIHLDAKASDVVNEKESDESWEREIVSDNDQTAEGKKATEFELYVDNFSIKVAWGFFAINLLASFFTASGFLYLLRGWNGGPDWILLITLFLFYIVFFILAIHSLVRILAAKKIDKCLRAIKVRNENKNKKVDNKKYHDNGTVRQKVDTPWWLRQ